jgi:hypothetical protein
MYSSVSLNWSEEVREVEATKLATHISPDKAYNLETKQQHWRWHCRTEELLSSPPHYHIWVLCCDFLHLQISFFFLNLPNHENLVLNIMGSGFMSILLPGELLQILDMCEENRQWNVWTSEQKSNTKKQKEKTKEYAYQACKRKPSNKRFAGFLIMSNLLQSSGPRLPTVRFSRCSSVPSLCTSTRETQRECKPCHQDFRNKRSSVIISPKKKNKKKSGVREQYQQQPK